VRMIIPTAIGDMCVRDAYDEEVVKEVITQRMYEHWGELNITGTVLDCGAHIGSFSKLALFLGATKVIAVEPHPDNFKLLQQNCTDNRMVFVNKAITREPFPHLATSDRNELHTLSKDGLAVSGISLDELLTEPIDFLKMDIEGGEYDAFYSCKKLHLVKQISIEYHDGGKALGELLVYLASQGFEMKWLGGGLWGHCQWIRL
jgi:FkbM family methyltransferase